MGLGIAETLSLLSAQKQKDNKSTNLPRTIGNKKTIVQNALVAQKKWRRSAFAAQKRWRWITCTTEREASMRSLTVKTMAVGSLRGDEHDEVGHCALYHDEHSKDAEQVV